MTIEDIRNYCLKLPGVTEDIKWENHLCFNVGEKMFIVTSPDTLPVSASFKTSEELFDELSTRPGMKPAPYMARNKWIYIDNIDRLQKKEWIELIEIAYDLIFNKLTAKIKKQIKP